MLRFQQYIELVRAQTEPKLVEAIAHAKKHLFPLKETYPKEVQQACGLLAFPPAIRSASYADLYSAKRWATLADLFTKTHFMLLALPSAPLLHIALSAGLSALKTPACHASHAGLSGPPTHSSALAQSVCPICSTELNELARNVPYAHHTQSHVEHDLLLLPNRRVYGKERLDDYARKMGLSAGQVKDLRTGEIFKADELKKVFIT